MKKAMLLWFGSLLALNVLAVDELILRMPSYQVVSDIKNVKVPVGRCQVMGKVSPTIDIAGFPGGLKNCTIATLDRSYETKTDSLGNFSLMIESTDTALFFYKDGLQEIVIWHYNFQSQHVVTINFYPGFSASDEQPEKALKPVIYLYSENEINAEVKLSCKGALTYTYPLYQEGWNVIVSQNGIRDTSGNAYPYLFWEGIMDIDFKTTNGRIAGFVISADSCIIFLEHQLSVLGLNDQQKTDFITFWAPRMVQHEQVLVQFLVDDEYSEEIASLSVTPAPDAMRRVYMIFSAFDPGDTILEIVPQQFNAFERKGLTVMEWGGSELQNAVIAD